VEEATEGSETLNNTEAEIFQVIISHGLVWRKTLCTL